MALLYGAFSIGDRPRVLGAQRRPASRAEPGERRRELREVEPVVRHPRGGEVEGGERSEPRVRDGVPEGLGRRGGGEREGRRLARCERGRGGTRGGGARRPLV